MRPVKLRAGDFLVVGRDKGPGVDYVAKVNCVSGVHCQFEMDGQKLFVTDLGKFILMLVRAIRLMTSCIVYRTPFAPNGAEGVLAGASVVFFSFVGFDTVATCAEECANPGRDLPIGIMGSLGICAALYAAMCLVITGMSPASSIDTVRCIVIKCYRMSD